MITATLTLIVARELNGQSTCTQRGRFGLWVCLAWEVKPILPFPTFS